MAKYNKGRKNNSVASSDKRKRNAPKHQAGKSKQNKSNGFDRNATAKPKKDQKKMGKSSYSSKNSRRKPKSDSESEFEEVATSAAAKRTDADSFPTAECDADIEMQETRKLFQQQNRKKKKSGGFQSMGLSHAVYKGVIRKGYKIPTPIQRKTIPLIMDRKDVVAMARTGSGKTAAFLVPMFENLKTHLTSGVRALILAPTRELALQTLKFTKELGRFTGLKFAVVLGGDSMAEQFTAIHENPDVIIATPGRFMHVLVEMELKLSSVEYIVFDEADRLFEMGFQEQMREILQRVPENRQTVLFSATLPKLLVDFAKAGLHDPTLIRLDVESKLSENLKMAFLQCQSENKMAALLHLLRNVIKPSEQTVIFAATKHHVEFINQVLLEAGFRCSYSYSSLDQTARKINVAKFRNKKSMILIVTDLAARGIDIPLLDNVINYNFPAKSKLFVHRVGRVARAGQSGMAFSLIASDEVAYVLDLHLFLGRSVKYVEIGKSSPAADEVLYGLVPQSVIDDEEQNMRQLLEIHDIDALHKVMNNAYKQYLKSRPPASSESIKRSKEQNIKIGFHPLYGAVSVDVEAERTKLLQDMRTFKPRGTIFEVNAHKKTEAFNIMKTKRIHHGNVIQRNELRHRDKDEAQNAMGDLAMPTRGSEVNDADIHDTFSLVIAPKANKGLFDDNNKSSKSRRRQTGKDEEFYVSYRPKDHHTEKGFSMEGSTFDMDADKAALDIDGDDAKVMKKQQSVLRWDRKRKKYVNETGNEPGRKRMKTESGQWISSTYKSNIYQDWLSKNKVTQEDDASDNDDAPSDPKGGGGKHWHGKNKKGQKGGGHATKKGFRNGAGGKMDAKKHPQGKNELKRKEQIVKQRRKKQKLESFMKHREKKGKGKKQSQRK